MSFDMQLTRKFDATPLALWRALTDSDLMREWWGPTGFTAPVTKMDVRKGGRSLVCMRSPEGFEIYNTWTYEAVEKPNRLEFVQRFSDKAGNPMSPSAYGLPAGIPETVPHQVTLKPVATNQTELTWTEHGFATEAIRDISRAGLDQCLDKLERVLKK